MRAVITRAIVPALLLLGGIAALVYGAKFHTAAVFEEKEIEEKIPSPFGMPPPFAKSPQGLPFPPGAAPAWPDAMDFPVQVIKHKVLVPHDQSEPALIRDATVGGVVLLSSGELKRTYSGKAPSLCPT